MKPSGASENNTKWAVERDMKPRTFTEDDSFSTKVFKNYPLVGDYIVSEAALEKMYANTKRYIDTAMTSREKPTYKQWLYEQVAIVVVTYAKQWNSNSEGKFSRYIAMQFGYRDDSGRVWHIITEALDRAFNNGDKLFVKSSNGEREFYETTMVHSFGPSKAWEPLIDLLFRFYADNLEWNYVPGDPLFARLVSVLTKYFNSTLTEDDKFLIASNYYYLRVGIRRLVQTRPGYSAFLFEQIVRRIHQLIHNNAPEAKRYSLALVDDWFVNRISQAEVNEGKTQSRKSESTEVALDYSAISIKYVLSNGLPALRIPAIRLIDESIGEAFATVYSNEKAIASFPLTIRGNELGETIQAKTVPLPLNAWANADIDCRMVISRGSSVIFDSENTLFRQMIVFSEGKEINASRIRREKYTVFAAHPNKLHGTNVDIVPFANGLCEIAFHKNFYLEYSGNSIAIDSSDIQGIRLVKPAVSDSSTYVYMGEEYLIARQNTSLKVYYSDQKVISKYQVQINGTIHALTEYHDEVAGNRAVIPFNTFNANERISIALIDFASGTVSFKQNYFILPEYTISFDKKYYTSEDDVSIIGAKITIGNEEYSLQANCDTDISIDYCDGQIVSGIPFLKYQYVNVTPVVQGRYIRVADISPTSSIRITNQTGLDCVVLIGDVAFQNEQMIPLYWLVEKDSHRSKLIDVVLEIDGSRKVIGKIAFEDQFVSQPKVAYQEGKIIWDGGQSYVGASGATLELLLIKNNQIRYTFPLHIEERIIAECAEFEDGVYICKITSCDRTLTEFCSFIGDERRARFEGKTIHINQVTEDVADKATAVRIKTVYIDQIKYVDTCYVDTEDDVFDVYTGCMYWVNYKGEKRYYSFKYNDARSKYKVNPVKIIYISNRYLRIVNEDDEGIYYFNNEFSANPGNEITDIEPSNTAKGYHDILFYMYTVDNPEKREAAQALYTASGVSVQKQKTIDVPVHVDNDENVTDKNLALFPNIHEAQQSTVITADPGARILVNAGPGTGKTWTLIERIIHLIQENVDPEAIQVLCFSRAAVEVVRQRMERAIAEERIDVNANKVDVRTFDSFATQLLYWVQESGYKAVPKSLTIESLSYEDRILRFIDVLSEEPQLIEQCEHLIVDEVQDLVLSRAKMVLEMIRQLPKESGVTLFGDACQAIYDYQADEGMGSTDFYNSVQKRGDFTCYSFSQNYRQVSALQNYCVGYRDAILENDIKKCNENVTRICDDLPDCSVPKLHRFQEDTLDQLVDKGNVGILTRSNAQALIISSIFRNKNIPHIVQRRLAEDSLSGWIALFFNQSPMKYYNEDDFVSLFKAICPTYSQSVDPGSIWDAISDTYSATTGRLSAKNLLLSIKNKGRCKGLFTEAPVSSVTVSTIHRSKGREYDSVILLTNLLSTASDEVEEHRVNYVALSRAKSRMYKVNLENAYFRTLENRRCYSVGTFFTTGSHYLRFFEIGKKDDLVRGSFASLPGVQQFIREKNHKLIGKEVYLQFDKMLSDGSVSYQLRLRENDMLLAVTSQAFSSDLCSAIRDIKNLPSYAKVYERIFPPRLSGIYITDIASEIGMVQGQEKDVIEHDGFATWNTLLLEGYAKAEY